MKKKGGEMKKFLYKRILVLVKSGRYYDKSVNAEELKVLEISPSGEWVKVMDQYGKKYWKDTGSIDPIEVLEEKEECPNKKKKEEK
jgi:hypothetical protein